ncbi:MAG: response regulator [Deltaproteobacteria bacterium]|nr:response regulator [Deltaproteobacteria bacterium]
MSSYKPKVLVVDDEARFRETLIKLLNTKTIEATGAESGMQALEKIQENTYDVILLDVRMPGMTGIEALAKIKKIDPLLEVIILTGHASVDTAIEIMKHGGCEYLLKPCPVDELTARIDAAYERKVTRTKVRAKTT